MDLQCEFTDAELPRGLLVAQATSHQAHDLALAGCQVMRLVAGGLRNKQSAWELGISEFTLQIHRAQVMRKMRARSIADLVRMAGALKVPHLSLHEGARGRSPREYESLEAGLPDHAPAMH